MAVVGYTILCLYFNKQRSVEHLLRCVFYPRPATTHRRGTQARLTQIAPAKGIHLLEVNILIAHARGIVFFIYFITYITLTLLLLS